MQLPLPDWVLLLGVILTCLYHLHHLNNMTDKEWNDRHND